MNKQVVVVICMSVLMSLAASCNQSSQPTGESASVQAAPAKRYRLKGKVVSIDKQAKMANIDSEAIPGFMDAMTMPYPVKPESELDQLQPGDLVTGELVVQDDNSWLENVSVTGHSSATSK